MMTVNEVRNHLDSLCALGYGDYEAFTECPTTGYSWLIEDIKIVQNEGVIICINEHNGPKTPNDDGN